MIPLADMPGLLKCLVRIWVAAPTVSEAGMTTAQFPVAVLASSTNGEVWMPIGASRARSALNAPGSFTQALMLRSAPPVTVLRAVCADPVPVSSAVP